MIILNIIVGLALPTNLGISIAEFPTTLGSYEAMVFSLVPRVSQPHGQTTTKKEKTDCTHGKVSSHNSSRMTNKNQQHTRDFTSFLCVTPLTLMDGHQLFQWTDYLVPDVGMGS